MNNGKELTVKYYQIIYLVKKMWSFYDVGYMYLSAFIMGASKQYEP